MLIKNHKWRFIAIITLLLLAFNSAIVAQPTLVFPKDSIVTYDLNITFIWNKVDSATSYDFQIDTFSNFSTSTNLNVSLGNDTTPNLIHNKTYYWQVRAIVGGVPGNWSKTGMLQTFNPNSLTGVSLWLSADTGISVSPSPSVIQWVDRSANQNVLGIAGAINSPNYVDSVPLLNNKPVVSFDGINDYLYTTHNSSLDFGTELSVFFVTNILNQNGAFFAKSAVNWFPGGTDFQMQGSLNNRYRLSFVNVSGAANVLNIDVSPDTGTMLWNANRMPTTGSVFRNGIDRIATIATSGAGNPDVDNTLEFRLGRGRSIGYFYGDYAEVLLLTQVPDSTTRKKIEGYLFYKYAPPVNLGVDSIFDYGFCNTDTLDASDRYITYLWSTGETSSSIVVDTSGIFSVTVTDIFGRVSVDTVIVEFPEVAPPPSLFFCFGDFILWDPGLSDAPLPYAYNWSDNSTADTLLITTPGNYTLTVTDFDIINGPCSVTTDTYPVDADSIIIKVYLDDITNLCVGNPLGLLGEISLVDTYLWSNGDTTPTIQNPSAGPYSVTATSFNGCKMVDATIVQYVGSGITTGFSSDIVCLGNPTTFTDETITPGGITIVAWFWEFGGGDTSDLQNPQYTFLSSGNHNVTLTVTTSEGCEFPHSDVALVNDTPRAIFLDTLSCFGDDENFISKSTFPPNDPITNYLWNFGDGFSDTVKNPIHLYSSIGNYQVSLTVTTGFGCISTYVDSFEVIPQVPPLPPSTLIYPNDGMYIYGGTITFRWNTVPGAVNYIVEIDSDPNFNSIIDIYNSTADTVDVINNFTQSKLYWRVTYVNICGAKSYSDTLSFNKFLKTTFNNMAVWLMGDSTEFTGSGNNTLLWKDQSGNDNDATQTGSKRPNLVKDSIMVGRQVLRFDGVDDYMEVPHSNSLFFDVQMSTFMVLRTDTLSFGSVSQGLLSKRPLGGNPGFEYLFASFRNNNLRIIHVGLLGLIWEANKFNSRNMLRIIRDDDIGDLGLNSVPLPFTTLITAQGQIVNNTLPLFIGTERSAQGSLNGDIAEIIMYQRALDTPQALVVEQYLNDKYAPPVNLGPDITIDYGFCDQVVLDAEMRFVNYLWSTGDTTRYLNVTESGTYSVTVTNIFGYISSDSVNVSVPNFRLPGQDAYCYDSILTWYMELPKSGYNYLWSIPNDDTLSVDSFIVISTPDTFSVVITDTNNCTISTSLFINVDSFELTTSLGPDETLCSGAELTLQTGAEDAVTYYWNDGSRDTGLIVTQTGLYAVTVTNEIGCEANDDINILINGELADVDFSFNNTCLNETTFFTNSSTVQPPFTIQNYFWDFGDTIFSNDSTPSHLYLQSGSYDVTLYVETDSGCINSLTKTIDVHPLPIPNFSFGIICAQKPITFTDESINPQDDSITMWNWDFGDGSTSTDINPIHIYNTQGVYYVTLTVNTSKGCSNSITIPVEIFPAFIADFVAENFCENDLTQFCDNTNGFSTIYWQWDMGDALGFYQAECPTHIYSNAGFYDVSLTVINSIGCQDDTTRTIEIFAPPIADFNNEDGCMRQDYQFNDLSSTNINDPIINWNWSFGDGNTSIDENPIHNYDTNGTYNVILSIETENGCFVQAQKQVIIRELPEADFTFDPDYGASPLEVTFTNQSEGAINYNWLFGDSATSTEENPIHIYNENDDFVITLIVTDDVSCADTTQDEITVKEADLNISIEIMDIYTATLPDGTLKVTPWAKILNKGTRTVRSFEIHSFIGSGPRISETWDEGEELRTGHTMIYTFQSSFITTSDFYKTFLCVEAVLPNGEPDQDPSDNKACTTIEGEIQIRALYPNPASDIINLEVILEEKTDLRITVYDALGKSFGELFNGEANEGLNHFILNVKLLASGVYFFEIENGEDMYVLKFMVEI